MKELWEIILPNNFPYKRHKEWDKKISQLVGGVTIYRGTQRGRWNPIGSLLPPATDQTAHSENGDIVYEDVIIARVAIEAATERPFPWRPPSQLQQVLEFTKEHYSQDAIMAYIVSPMVVIY